MLSMADVKDVLKELTADEKEALRDRIKTFMGYKEEIDDLRDSMKE